MTRTTSVRAGVAFAAAILVAGCAAASSPQTTPPSVMPASVVPAPSAAACPAHGDLGAGTYALSAKDTQAVPAVITVTEGWAGCGLMTKEFGEPGGLALIAFWSVENVYGDPCHWRSTLMHPAVGPGVDDLAAALVDQDVTEASTPTDDTLGGFAGKYLRLSVPLDADVTACDRVEIAEFRFLNGPGDSVWWLGAADAPGLVGEVWILDVDAARVVIQAAYFADATQPEVDEIHGIVRSINLRP